MADPGYTDVVSANILCTLDRATAARALAIALEPRPHLVGLQEWDLRRRGMHLDPAYLWVTPAYGDCVLGARRDRYTLLGRRTVPLGWFARCERRVRPVPVLPPRRATVATLHDRERDRTVSLVGYHLVPGTQRSGEYRGDRPLLAARHQREAARLGALVADLLGRGHVVHALGDSNFDGLRIPGLTSAWAGREHEPVGTLTSHRKIDDVFGPGPATSVRLLKTGSDHQAVLVRRHDDPDVPGPA